MNDPVKLAKENAHNGVYRLYSAATGKDASEADARTLGVTCSEKVETNPTVFGCNPMPVSIARMMVIYNLTMIEQRDFPYKEVCKPSNDGPDQNLEDNSSYWVKLEDALSCIISAK